MAKMGHFAVIAGEQLKACITVNRRLIVTGGVVTLGCSGMRRGPEYTRTLWEGAAMKVARGVW